MLEEKDSSQCSSLQLEGDPDKSALCCAGDRGARTCQLIHENSLPCVFCRALGDAFSQKIEGAERLDLKRSLKTSVYGAAFIGKRPSAFTSVSPIHFRSASTAQ